MRGYKKVEIPKQIPVQGNKLIEEFIGRVHTGDEKVSVAHMVAPPLWYEPPQTPEFDEVTIMLRGQMNIKVNNENVLLSAGEVIITYAGTTIQYSNPSEEESEYWAICVPAFSPETANREL